MEPIRSIVVPTDFRPLSQAATARAATIAQLDDAAIHLVHIVRFPLIAAPYEVSVPGAVWKGVRAAAGREMEAARQRLEEGGISKISDEIDESSDPVGVIEAAVKAQQADLVVMGTHGRTGLSHAFLGSVAERTLRRVNCPVLTVKGELAETSEPIHRILLATDFSADSERAAEFAAGLATRFGGALDIVHAFDFPADYLMPLETTLERSIQEKAASKLDDISRKLDVSNVAISLHLQRGRASAVISETAETLGSQLIVMGRRGSAGLAHVLLGSVAERTLRAAPCSVLTVRA